MAAAKTLAEALLNVQKNAPKLEKDGKNPHFKNEYVTLDSLLGAVLPVLQENNILLSQEPSFVNASDGAVATLVTRLTHVPTGEAEASVMLLTLDKATPQGQGSAITYARRYSIASILGLITETDDDGNSASGAAKKESGEKSDAQLKQAVWKIAKAKLDKKTPTIAEVAKLFEVKQAELSERETLETILKAEGEL